MTFPRLSVLSFAFIFIALCAPRGLNAQIAAAPAAKRVKMAPGATETPLPFTSPRKYVYVDDPDPAAHELHERRMEWWRPARFGMFIHWGLYAIPAGAWHGHVTPGFNGEWIMHDLRIPVDDYAALAKEFNPVKFDAEAWVALAQEAGMKYIVFTAKHHDGFAMYRSRVSPFNIYDATPFKRDPLAELAAACKKHGIKLGVYYSQAQDWHHPGGDCFDGGPWDEAQKGSLSEYVDTIAYPQVKELLENYPDIAILWWDTGNNLTPAMAAKFTALVKAHPNLITNNRLGGGVRGDMGTPEQKIPAAGLPGQDWESCMTMNHTWGYKSFDKDFKSSQTLIRNLVETASKGGNYLLNVGPMPDGAFPPESVERLKEIGSWMKVNGESIYGTTACSGKAIAFPGIHGFNETDFFTGTVSGSDVAGPSASDSGLPWDFCTAKGRDIFVHIFTAPDRIYTSANVTLYIAQVNPKRCVLLGAPNANLTRKEWHPEGMSGFGLELPRILPDPIDTVIVLQGALGRFPVGR